MERKALTFIAIVAVIVILAVFSVSRFKAVTASQQQTISQVFTVKKGTVRPTLTLTGSVAADEYQVKAASSGKVKEIYVTEGTTVTAGQKLLALDSEDVQQDVNIAWANYSSAKARLQELKDKSASAAEVASQNAAVAKAWADYKKAVKARDDLVLISPINGTVIQINTSIGEQVGAGSSLSAGSNSSTSANSSSTSGLVAVADLSKLYIKAPVDQADITKIAVGQKAKITLDALPEKEFTGQVMSIDAVPETNQNVVTYNVYLSLAPVESAMRLGMSADIVIDLGQKRNVLIVPNLAIRSRGKEKVVTKLTGGQPTRIVVKTGASDAENTEITSGLLEGDKIIVLGLSELGAGSFSGSFGSNRSGVFGSGRSGQRGFMMPMGQR